MEDAADDKGNEGEPGVDPAAAGVEQFQRAALDAVRAARAMLDAAESIVKDPAALDSVVRTATGFARSAGQAVMGFGGHYEEHADAADAVDDDPPGGGFERIRVD